MLRCLISTAPGWSSTCVTVREARTAMFHYHSEHWTCSASTGGVIATQCIEAIYPNTIDRANLLRSLNLPTQPTASQTNTRGKLEEYFATANVVLTYASGDAGTGVSRVGYYSPKLFESAVANVPRTPQSQIGTTAANSPAPERPKLSEPARRAGQSSPSSAGSSSSSEAERTTVTRSTSSANRPSTPSAGGVPFELRDGPGANAVTEMRESNKEVPISGARLDKLVGSYEFDAAYVPSLEEVIVDKVDGKLRWKDRSTMNTLISSGVGQQSEAAGGVVEEVLQFKLAGKPGVKVQFILSKGKVDRVTYLEDKAGKTIFAIGTPKD